YQPAKFLLLIHHGESFRKFLNHEYQEGKTDMFDFVDIYCFSVYKLDIMVLQLGYDGINKPMCYQYLRPMTDLDVGLLALGLDEDVHSLTSLISNFKVIEVFIEHGITKLNCYYMSNSLIRVTIEEYQEDMVLEASSASPKKNELLMLKCFDITNIDDRLEVVSCDVVHFAGSCHKELSHDETFGTNDLDPPPPFDMNILAHVSTDEGILSDYAKVQDILDKELGNENELDYVNYASVNKDTRHSNTTRVDEHLNNDNAPLENAALIEAKDDDDVMIDEENKIHEAKVEVHLSGLEESDYQFTNIGVSSEVPDNVFMEKDRYEMDINDFNIVSGGEGDFPGGRKKHVISSKRLSGKVKIKGRTYNFLAKKILDQIKVNPGIPVKAVQDILQRELEVHISMSKAFRAKAKANKEIKGDH
nr:hypothetical protein [Tanacetum cinerariifolium]